MTDVLISTTDRAQRAFIYSALARLKRPVINNKGGYFWDQDDLKLYPGELTARLEVLGRTYIPNTSRFIYVLGNQLHCGSTAVPRPWEVWDWPAHLYDSLRSVSRCTRSWLMMID